MYVCMYVCVCVDQHTTALYSPTAFVYSNIARRMSHSDVFFAARLCLMPRHQVGLALTLITPLQDLFPRISMTLAKQTRWMAINKHAFIRIHIYAYEPTIR